MRSHKYDTVFDPIFPKTHFMRKEEARVGARLRVVARTVALFALAAVIAYFVGSGAVHA